MAAAAGRGLLRSVACRIARVPPQHQLHGCSPGRPYIYSSTPSPTNMARTYGGKQVERSSISDDDEDVLLDLACRVMRVGFKLCFCAVAYNIWGKPVVEDITAMRGLLEESRNKKSTPCVDCSKRASSEEASMEAKRPADQV